MEERRKVPRVPLDCPVFATLQGPDGRQVFCLLRDVSSHGAQVSPPPGEPVWVNSGDVLNIVEPALVMDGEAMILQAEVAWTQDGVFGIRFSQEGGISPRMLQSLMVGCKE